MCPFFAPRCQLFQTYGRMILPVLLTLLVHARQGSGVIQVSKSQTWGLPLLPPVVSAGQQEPSSDHQRLPAFPKLTGFLLIDKVDNSHSVQLSKFYGIDEKVWSRPWGDSFARISTHCSQNCHQHHETLLDFLFVLRKERLGRFFIFFFNFFLSAQRKDDSTNTYNSFVQKSGIYLFFHLLLV